MRIINIKYTNKQVRELCVNYLLGYATDLGMSTEKTIDFFIPNDRNQLSRLLLDSTFTEYKFV